MASDEEDFVFYGTPIEREEEMTSRKKKSVAEAAGQLRSLPAWKQEVLDEEGRRRFHGAFTGGYSAGYYNTVGSREGWAPQTFTSSRKKRAEMKEQSIYNFLDDDEKAEMESQSLTTSLQFDTFGFTAAEIARKQAEKEQKKRSSAIPGPAPDEIIVPALNSIGVKLLMKMGWRHGRSIKDSHANSLYDARREARKALLAFSSEYAKSATEFEPNENEHEGAIKQFAEDEIHACQSTPVFVLNPKQDMHGLGYDPFKHAPEFREKKRLRLSGNLVSGKAKATSIKGNLFSSKSGKVAPGFGIGALEELDFEDEDIYTSALELEEKYVQEIEEPSSSSRDNKKLLIKDAQGMLPGFRVASNSNFQLERFDPPVIPIDFEPHHKFSASLETENKLAWPPPPEVPLPEDNNLRILIDGFATLVARCGNRKLFEDLSREKNKTNPLFSFLSGGNGHDYYERKLWDEQQRHSDQKKQPVDLKSMQSVQRMTAEARGKILGERPLERSSKESSSAVASADAIHLQFNLSDTFIKPASLNEFLEATKPFKDDPAKQERFEQFLKEKYQGGLRSTDSGGSSNLSEEVRARERLDFEAAAEAIEKGRWGQSNKLSSAPHFMDSAANMKFTSGGIEQAGIPLVEEQTINKMYPKREEFQWRPSPILCKRFEIIDPYMGKPPPLPKAKSRVDSLIFKPDFVKTKSEETFAATRDSLLASLSEPQETSEQVTSAETGTEPNNTNAERPVDLYKAIFSDDSDDEGEDTMFNQGSDSKAKSEVASTTLNRLIAGDFLESLGKELGLEVPLEPPLVTKTIGSTVSQKETINTSTEDVRIPSANVNTSSSLNATIGPSKDQQAARVDLSHSEFIQGASDRKKIDHDDPQSIVGNVQDENNPDKAKPQKIRSKDDTNRMGSRRRRSSSTSSDDERSSRHSRRHRNSSPEDERNDAHPRRRRHESSTPDTDSSEDSGYRDYTKRESGKKGSSRRKSGGRKRSKHNSSRCKDSPTRSSRHGSGREPTEDWEETKKSRGRRKDSSCSKSDSRRKYH